MFHKSSTGSYGREKTRFQCFFGSSSGPFHMFQRLAQLMPRAVYVGLYGAEREIEGRGNFLVRAPLHVAEHDARTVLGTETRDRALDRATELTGLHLVQRRFLLRGEIERRRLDFCGRRGVRRPIDAD